MSEQPLAGRPVDHEALAEMISHALMELPGITRLEPTLKSTLARMRSASVRGVHRWTGTYAEAASTGRDGIHLTVTGGVVNLMIDLATDVTHSSIETAKTAQHAAAQAIEQAGLQPGTIDISILSIESR